MNRLDRSKMFWSAAAAVFGSLLLLGFVAPPGSGGDLGTGRAQPASATTGPTTQAERVQQYTCADGQARDMAITVTGADFAATGELTSITPNGLTVRALPAQLILAPPMEGSAAHGYLAGDVVTATGVITANGTYQAMTIAPACGGALVTEITPVPTVAPPASAVVQPPVQSSDQQNAGHSVVAGDPGDGDAVVFQPGEGDDDDDHDEGGRGDKPNKNKHDDDDDDDGEGGDDD